MSSTEEQDGGEAPQPSVYGQNSPELIDKISTYTDVNLDVVKKQHPGIVGNPVAQYSHTFNEKHFRKKMLQRELVVHFDLVKMEHVDVADSANAHRALMMAEDEVANSMSHGARILLGTSTNRNVVVAPTKPPGRFYKIKHAVGLG